MTSHDRSESDAELACPACFEGRGVPSLVTTKALGDIVILFTCQSCGQEWATAHELIDGVARIDRKDASSLDRVLPR